MCSLKLFVDRPFVMYLLQLIYLQRCHSYSDRRFPDRRNRLHEIHVSLPRFSHSYSMPATPRGFNLSANCGHELSQAELPVLGNGRFGSSPYYHQSNLPVCRSSHTNAFSFPYESLEHGSSWPENSVAEPFPEGNNYFDLGSSDTLSRSQSSVESTIQNSESSSPTNQGRLCFLFQLLKYPYSFPPMPFSNCLVLRVEEQSYRLKDEDDFPPLSISASPKMLTCQPCTVHFVLPFSGYALIQQLSQCWEHVNKGILQVQFVVLKH